MENEENQNLNTNQPPAQPIAESEKQSFLSSKWLKIGAVVVIIILVLSLTFVLGKNNAGKSIPIPPPDEPRYQGSPTPTPDQTADWKTYENNQEGWQIKYPADKVSYKNGRFYLTGQDNIMTADGYGPELSISSTDKSTLESRKSSGKDTEINGLPALKISSIDPNLTDNFNLFVSSKDGKKVVYLTFLTKKDQDKIQNGNNIQTVVDQESIDLMKKIVDQILSTFKFTDSSNITPTPNPTINWKTFTNQKYSYSIKYPGNLTVNEQNTYYHYVEFRLPNGADGSVYIAPYLVSVIPETFTASDPAAYNYMTSDVINSFFSMKSGEIKKIDTSTFTKLPDTTVGGQTGIAVNVTATGTNQKRVYIKHNGNIYMITDNNNPSANFQNFLSTFKFTN